MSMPSGDFAQGDPLALAAEFPAADREQWRELVAEVLRRSGPDPDSMCRPEDALASTTYDGITLQPLYDAADVAGLPGTGWPGSAPYTRGARPDGGAWQLRQRQPEPDPETANEAILAELEGGVDGLWLPLGDGALPIAGLERALRDVDLELISVVLQAGAETEQAAQALWRLAQRRGVSAENLTGNLGADPLGDAARNGGQPDVAAVRGLAQRCHHDYPGLRAATVDALPYHHAGAGDAQELGCAVASGVEYLRAMTDDGLGLSEAFGQLEFRMAASAEQFPAMAKLRAGRRLWSRVAEVCGLEPHDPAAAQSQHVVTSPAMLTERDPWVNILRTTLACFAAGTGGASAVTVLPFDSRLGLPDGFARRVARNTQSLLQAEAKVGAVTDPAGGSWFVESLTEQLAAAAWEVFTGIEAAGGMAEALRSGHVGTLLEPTRRARRSAIAHRRDPIIGVSEYPNLAETLPRRSPAPQGGPGPAGEPSAGLPRFHHAEEFERLRARSDARAASTGSAPSVFLAVLGPLAAHTGRAGFAENLLAAGGITTSRCDPELSAAEIAESFTASATAVACLCGSDAGYAEQAGPVAAALRQAGAGQIWLAGPPAEYPDVDEYLYAGCDALQVLESILTALEVR